MTEESTSEPQKDPEQQQAELKEIAQRATEQSKRITDGVGKLMEEEGIQTCVFIGMLEEPQLPVIFYRGEINKATRLAAVIRQMLVQKIQDQISP